MDLAMSEFFTLEEARALFPEGNRPSTRWISRTAEEIGCKVRVGKHVLITADFLERLREWRSSKSDPSRAVSSTVTRRSSRSGSRPAKLSTDGVSEALELARSAKPERSDSGSKPKPMSGQVVPFKKM